MTAPSLRPLGVFALALTLAWTGPAATRATAAPEGQLTWGVHVSLAPTWFDPAETPGIITPFMLMYALHDGIAKAMPGNPLAPSVAESWKSSPDGRVWDFTLRKGVKFHDGSDFKCADAKYSLDRLADPKRANPTFTAILKNMYASSRCADDQTFVVTLKRPAAGPPVSGTMVFNFGKLEKIWRKDGKCM